MSYLAPVTGNCWQVLTLLSRLAGRHRDFRWLTYTEVLLCGDLFYVTEVSRVKDVKLFLYHSWIAGAKLSLSTFFQANNVQSPYFKYFLKV